MTKPLIELVEEYGQEMFDFGQIGTPDYCDAAKIILSELRTRLEALERDAARYQWLRDESVGQYTHPIVVDQHRSEIGMHYVGPLYSVT